MRRAFTLIELLVVVAIIAILAAVLFPVFAKARKRARVVHCISNLKQIGTAIGPYLSDWDETYPSAYMDWLVVLGNHPSFHETMNAYVSDKRIWQCPSDTGEVFLYAPNGYQQRTPPFYSDRWSMSSYLYLGLGYGEDYGQIGGHKAPFVKRPSLAVLSAEARPWHGGYDPNMQDYFNRSPAPVNVLFCDGHVARRTRAQWGTDAVLGLQP
jgi:prepilin-type N-terminal cleavage/methylation domain-containing protein/prepilin-type processing-associated H-X9-DG protein